MFKTSDKESWDVSLYKYLDNHRSNNPSNPLNYTPSSKLGLNSNLNSARANNRWANGLSRSSSVKGFAKNFNTELKDKGRLISPMEYTFNTHGGVNRSIAAPQQYRMGDRGQTI